MITVPTSTSNISATKSSARRCLFGRLDHKRINESLERELRNLDQRLEKKWDFDFVKERPLPGGRYAWSAVEKTEYVPGPYTREYPAKPTRPRTQGGLKRRLNFEEEAEVEKEGFASPPHGCSSGSSDENASPTPLPTEQEVTAANTSSPRLRLSQSHITAFYQQRKRQRSDKC